MAILLGPDWQRDLWTSPYRLRFELNQSGSYVNMFTRSYDRARALARAALPTDEVIGIVAAYPDPKREQGAKWRGWAKGTASEILAEMGVCTEQAIAIWEGYWWAKDAENTVDADDAEARPWSHRAVRLNWDQADILLWNQVAHDMGVTPQAPIMSKLVDVERGISVDCYDDRGMDITALTREPILELHTRFETWLLDYDRPRMLEAFRV